MSFTQLIPIFIVSGESALRYKDFCANLGAKGYFQKPVDFEALEERLAVVLEGRRGDRRREPRIQLRVTLKIKGTTAKGGAFELLTSSENVSAHGFLAACSIALKTGSIVEVLMMAAGQQPVAKARVVRIEWPDTPGQRCGFEFLGQPLNWVLR